MLSQPNPRILQRAPAFLTAAVLVAGFVFSMAATLPGELSYDSVIQLLEGRTAAYSGWHPPIMSWLLGIGDEAVPGAALFVACNAGVLFGATASLLWLTPRASWAAPLIAVVCVSLPQFAIYQGIVWKDVLFANAVVAGFVLLAHVAVRPHERVRRLVLLLAAFLLLIVGVLARQNGPILLVAAAAWFAWSTLCNGASRIRALAAGGAALASALAMFAVASVALNTRTVPDRGAAKQLRVLELYDLVGALKFYPNLQLPELQHSDPGLLAAMRSDGQRLYSPIRSDTLARSPRLQSALAQAPDSVLHRSWSNLVLHDPGLYLRERGAVFRWVFLTPSLSFCVPYVVGFRGPPQVLEALQMKQRFSPRDEFVDNYGRSFIGTPVFSHASYLVLAFLELAFLVYRRRAADTVFICMLLGSLVFSGSFFFISIACDYRYLYLLDLAALVSLLYIALDPRPRDAVREASSPASRPRASPTD